MLEKRSKLLCKEIFSETQRLLWDEQLSGLQSIPFVPAHIIDEELLQLCAAHRHPQFVPFQDSVISTHERLIWTQKPVLPPWASPENELQSQMVGIIHKPDKRDIIRNLKTVCKSPQFIPGLKKELIEPLTRFVCHTFLHIKTHHAMADTSDITKIPCIPIKECAKLLKPPQLCLKMPKNIAPKLLPYLSSFPLETFGEFVALLKKAGATDEITPKQYCEVLRDIYQESGNAELNPNQFKTAVHACKGLFKLIGSMAEYERTKLEHLYLPSSDCKMYVSNEVVYIDVIRFEKRVKNLCLPQLFFTKSSRGVNSQDIQSTFNCASCSLRPIFVSECVSECLEEECLETKKKTKECFAAESRLSSNEFCNGVIRLIRNGMKTKSNDAEEMQLIKKIADIQFFQLDEVRTFLTYTGDKLLESEEKQDVFVENGQNTVVYLSSSIKGETELCHKVCKIINDVMHNKLDSAEQSLLLAEIFTCRIGCIESVLDRENVAPYDAIFNEDKQKNLYNPGEYVPLKFHHLLEQAVDLLRKQEIVAYEVYDPLDDQEPNGTTEQSEEETPVYRYAIICEIHDNGQRSFANYQYTIHLGEDEYVKVHASELYRFSQPSQGHQPGPLVISSNASSQTENETPSTGIGKDMKNFEELKIIVRATLEEAWKMQESHRRRIIKRLFLEWHPDKNPDCIELATEMFKFIQNELERLEKGISVEDLESSGRSGSRYSRSSRNFNFYSRFYNRRARSHRSYRQQFEEEFHDDSAPSSPRSSYYTPPRHHAKNPQPTEAKRWMKQAEYDFQAVVNDVNMERGGTPAYEWACFKCHQAAEKALKATQFAVDAGLKDNSHNLPSLCNAVNNDRCRDLARSLENLVQGSAAMRYPDRHYGGQTPHDAYTREKTLKAKQYSSQIVEICRTFIQRAC